LLQGRYPLRDPYFAWERQYLADFSDLQHVMDVMVDTTERQLEDPAQDILHNRVCAAVAYRMASDMKLARNDCRLIAAGDLLHNIGKEDRTQVLTDGKLLLQASGMVGRLRAAERLTGSPWFWTDPGIFRSPAIGANLSLVHHITGAIAAGGILQSMDGFSAEDVLRVQEAILAHSTGCWYFRKSVDAGVRAAGAWRNLYPEPEGALAMIVHDADLVSQFDAESVVPEASKWRRLAAKRWGAEGPVEEAHVVYYVLERLIDEARTAQGRALAMQEWNSVRPALLDLMRLPQGEDPLRALGVPSAFH
jgi:hypothetical protein